MNEDTKKSHTWLRLGVVGCGRVFERYHLPALKKSSDWKLVAACEPLRERREWIQNSCQVLSTYESFATFLRESALDAVLITTPPVTHCQLAIQALETGQHVLVEKPMALNPSEAQLMLQASLRTHRKLWVGFNRRFRRPYLNLKEKLITVPKDRIQAIHFKLIIDSQNWNSVTPFLEEDSKGGGVLDDVASHQLDLLSWLLDQPMMAVRAEPLATKTAGSQIKVEVKFENNLIATCVAGHSDRYAENLEIELKSRKLLAYESGVLEVPWIPVSWTHPYCQFRTASHLIFHKLSQRPNFTLRSFIQQFNAFAAAIRNESASYAGADARSGVHSLQAIQACRASLQSGGRWKSLNH